MGHKGHQILSNQYIAALSGIVDEGVRRHFRLKKQHQAERERLAQDKRTETGADRAAPEPSDPEAGPCV